MVPPALIGLLAKLPKEWFQRCLRVLGEVYEIL